VQIQHDQVIGTGFFQQMRDQLRRDRFTRFGDAVLACVREVWQHHMHAARKAQFCRLAHEKELNDVFIGVPRCRLDDVDLLAADRFLKAHIDLSAAEFLQRNLPQRRFQLFRQIVSKGQVRGSREEVHAESIGGFGGRCHCQNEDSEDSEDSKDSEEDKEFFLFLL